MYSCIFHCKFLKIENFQNWIWIIPSIFVKVKKFCNSQSRLLTEHLKILFLCVLTIVVLFYVWHGVNFIIISIQFSFCITFLHKKEQLPSMIWLVLSIVHTLIANARKNGEVHIGWSYLKHEKFIVNARFIGTYVLLIDNDRLYPIYILNQNYIRFNQYIVNHASL